MAGLYVSEIFSAFAIAFELIVSFDREAQSMRMEFAATPALDNGNAQVMGGFLGCARAQFLRPAPNR